MHLRANRSKTPVLDQRRARLLGGLRRYITTALEAGVAVDASTSLLEARKVTYLLQAAGLELGFSFERGPYGPCCPELDRVISSMEGHYVVGYGDGTGGARADLRLLAKAAAAERLVMDDADFSRAWAIVERVIFGYEYPDGMELLATVHYVAARERPENIAELAGRIAAWNPRKRQLFTLEDIATAWDRLRDEGARPR